MRLRRRRRSHFDCTIFFDQLKAERGKRRAATLRAAGLRRHHRRAEAAVHVVDQEPGAPIGHAERAAGPRDRAGFADRFEQPDLARPQRPLRAEIDPHRQPDIAHRAPRTALACRGAGQVIINDGMYRRGRDGGLWCRPRRWTKLAVAHLTSLWRSVLESAQRRTIMGLFDSLKGALESEALPALLSTVLAQTQYHDLNGLVAALEKGGLGPQVQSWLGNGTNMPITADQLKAVLGNAQVQDFARRLGLPVDEMLKLLAQYLPEIVDKASPNGVLQPHA